MQKLSVNSFLLSVLIHLILLAGVFFSSSLPQNRDSVKEETKEIEIVSRPNQEKRPLRQTHQIRQKEPLPYQEDLLDRFIGTRRTKPTLEKTKNSFSNVDNILFKNLSGGEQIEKTPAYMNYYRRIREEIRKKAYQNYRGGSQGEVYLNFNVAKNGAVEAIKLISQSTGNPKLQQAALDSLKKSAPFPPFPDELNQHSRLQFSISIHFKHN